MLNKLGKQLLLLLMALPLSASVKMLAPDHFMEGEALSFQVIARGFKVKIPQIESIEGYSVENIKTSEETIIINTRRANKVTKTYRMFAKKSIVIPSFAIEIDDTCVKTKNKKVELQKITKTISDNFDLQMQLDKTDAYIGEESVLSVTFAYKDLEDYSLSEVDFSDFLLKELGTKEWIRADGHRVEEIRYSLTPQAEGRLILPPLKAEVEVLKSGHTRKISLFSNKLTLNVTALPKGLSLIGEYQLNASINRQSVNAGEAVTLVLTIEGVGNMDNLDALDLHIPGTMVYVKSVQKRQDNTIAQYSKTFEIISDRNFTIPAITLHYFDKTSQRKKTIQSRAFDIEVFANNLLRDKPKEKLDKDEVFKEITYEEERITGMERLIYFLIGILSSMVFMFMYKQFKNKTQPKKQPELIQVLKKIKTQDALFKKMVPHVGRDKDLDRLIYRLEGVEAVDFKEIKKEIIQKVQMLVC